MSRFFWGVGVRIFGTPWAASPTIFGAMVRRELSADEKTRLNMMNRRVANL
ncbi:MAG: hypothetical protein FWG70_10055 [Oscillospiraceae bacterium]|nr:hypothetical protein [Oscillospiraceae bacterium]